jgi:hypothetical protein
VGQGKISTHAKKAVALYDALGHDERLHSGVKLVLVIALRQYLEDLGAIARQPESVDTLNAFVLTRGRRRGEAR